MSTGDAGTAGATQGAADGGEAQQGPDIGQLASSLESMQAGQEELRQFLMNEPWKAPPEAQAPQAPQEPEAMDWSFLDPEAAEFEPQALAQKLGGLIEQTMAQREQQFLQQHLEPLREAQQNERIAREAQMLVDEFPDLGDPEIGPQVVQAARQVAEANGHPELANQPWFWRTIYMAGRAAQSASEEGAEPPAAAHLEGGSGARPGAQQVDMAEQIIPTDGVRRGRSVLPFS